MTMLASHAVGFPPQAMAMGGALDFDDLFWSSELEANPLMTIDGLVSNSSGSAGDDAAEQIEFAAPAAPDDRAAGGRGSRGGRGGRGRGRGRGGRTVVAPAPAAVTDGSDGGRDDGSAGAHSGGEVGPKGVSRVRALNKAAQKRFREKQKLRAEVVSGELEALREEVARLRLEKEVAAAVTPPFVGGRPEGGDAEIDAREQQAIMTAFLEHGQAVAAARTALSSDGAGSATGAAASLGMMRSIGNICHSLVNSATAAPTKIAIIDQVFTHRFSDEDPAVYPRGTLAKLLAITPPITTAQVRSLLAVRASCDAQLATLYAERLKLGALLMTRLPTTSLHHSGLGPSAALLESLGATPGAALATLAGGDVRLGAATALNSTSGSTRLPGGLAVRPECEWAFLPAHMARLQRVLQQELHEIRSFHTAVNCTCLTPLQTAQLFVMTSPRLLSAFSITDAAAFGHSQGLLPAAPSA